MDTSALENRLLFAIPKKGRLYEHVLELLKGADIQFTRKNRLDIALSTNLPLALVFLPAADIADYVGAGNVDIGITGQDIISESGKGDLIDELLSLGFGHCRLCLQVPQNSGYTRPEELVGKRIVTSFDCTARKFFTDLETKLNHPGPATQIHYVSGSVEAACGLGLADAIVDLVESGDTMRAAKLVDIHTILKTETVLICNRKKHADKTSETSILIDKICRRIKGVITAQKYVLCTYNIEKERMSAAFKITPGKKAPTVTTLQDANWFAVSVMVVKKDIVEVMDQLETIGATDILVTDIQNCRS